MVIFVDLVGCVLATIISHSYFLDSNYYPAFFVDSIDSNCFTGIRYIDLRNLLDSVDFQILNAYEEL